MNTIEGITYKQICEAAETPNLCYIGNGWKITTPDGDVVYIIESLSVNDGTVDGYFGLGATTIREPWEDDALYDTFDHANNNLKSIIELDKEIAEDLANA